MNKGPFNCLAYLLILNLAMSMMLAGCRSSKSIPESKTQDVGDPNVRLISMLEQKVHRFNTLKIKRADVDFTMNGVGEKVKGNIAIYRDSMIAVSVVPALGYELLRILCTPDSVIIINRPEKSYYASSFEYYRRKYQIPVDFNDLQALLSNEVFYYKDGYGDRIYEKQMKTRNDNNLFLVESFRDGSRITNQGIEIDREGRRLESVFIIDYDTKMKLNINYEEFSGNEEMLFPKRMKINLIESNNTINVEIYYGQIVFNDSINVEFSVPPQYTRGDL